MATPVVVSPAIASAPSSEPDPLLTSTAVQALIQAGIPQVKAVDLVLRKGEQAVLDQLRWLPFQKADSPGALIWASFRDGYQPPRSVLQKRQDAARKAQEADQRRAKREEAARLAESQESAWRALSGEERRRVEETVRKDLESTPGWQFTPASGRAECIRAECLKRAVDTTKAGTAPAPRPPGVERRQTAPGPAPSLLEVIGRMPAEGKERCGLAPPDRLFSAVAFATAGVTVCGPVGAPERSLSESGPGSRGLPDSETRRRVEEELAARRAAQEAARSTIATGAGRSAPATPPSERAPVRVARRAG